MRAVSEYLNVEKMLVKYTVSEFLSAKGSFSSIDILKNSERFGHLHSVCIGNPIDLKIVTRDHERDIH